MPYGTPIPHPRDTSIDSRVVEYPGDGPAGASHNKQKDGKWCRRLHSHDHGTRPESLALRDRRHEPRRSSRYDLRRVTR